MLSGSDPSSFEPESDFAGGSWLKYLLLLAVVLTGLEVAAGEGGACLGFLASVLVVDAAESPSDARLFGAGAGAAADAGTARDDRRGMDT